MTAPARIHIQALTKYFGNRPVLDGIDLSIALHEVVCLIGASGSGKSTLLRCINGLEMWDRGTVRLDGVPIDDPGFGGGTLQKRIAIVFQSFNLFPTMTVRDNITLAPCKVHGKARAEAEKTAHHLLTRFGMAAFAARYPEQLSGGQQQRVAIARALATDPDVLLLDEVTAALDPELVGEVLSIIRDLKARGLTMVIVTHEMGFARDIADRVAFLEGGRILEEGAPDRMFLAPHNARTRRFLQRIIDAGRL
ncbi:MAG: amino acid ABC transporter ATP-binding protein [Rhodobacteraceae bacterium]|nr:amino acid ABC transporter ATP-binding protein [Paracoccaceae bacterium]